MSTLNGLDASRANQEVVDASVGAQQQPQNPLGVLLEAVAAATSAISPATGKVGQQPKQTQSQKQQNGDVVTTLIGALADGRRISDPSKTRTTPTIMVDEQKVFQQQQKQHQQTLPSSVTLTCLPTTVDPSSLMNNALPLPSALAMMLAPPTLPPPSDSTTMSMMDPSNTQQEEPQVEKELVPCRARRMPIGHSFKTAHFEIPSDVLHGQDLICSYPACRDAGVKFQFCSVCRIPVAKRNFRMRHNHCDEIGAFPGPVAKSLAPTNGFVVSSGSGQEFRSNLTTSSPSFNSNGSHLPYEKASVDGMDSSPLELGLLLEKEEQPKIAESSNDVKKGVRKERYEQGNEITSSSDDQDSQRRRKKQRRDEASPSTYAHERSRHHSDSSNILSHEQPPASCDLMAIRSDRTSKYVSESRSRRWAALLNERPTDKEGHSMSKWLMTVMAVSNLSAPLKSSRSE